jgi:hypothetical protein
MRTARESLRLTKALVAGIWGFVLLMIILGNVLNRHKDREHRYETPTPVRLDPLLSLAFLLHPSRSTGAGLVQTTTNGASGANISGSG